MNFTGISRTIEKVIYITILLLLVGPVWLLEYFHTGDGPAHLNCAYVLFPVVSGDSWFNDFFRINWLPVPNSMIYLLLAVLLKVMSSFTATKVIVTFIILNFAAGYFVLARSLSEKKSLPVIFGLLIFCFPLKMGFYGFMLGLGVMMWTLSFYISKVKSESKKNIVWFSLLLILTWFTHFFAFASLLLFIFIYEVHRLIWEGMIRKNYSVTALLQRSLAFIPVASLIIIFYGKTIAETSTGFIERKVLNDWLINLTVMDNYGTEEELLIRRIFYTLISLAFIAWIFKKRRSAIATEEVYLLSSVIVLLLVYYLIPGSFFSGSIINLRILYLALIAAGLFADIILSSGLLSIIRTLAACIAIFFAAYNEYENLLPYSNEIAELVTVKDHIKEHSIILPLNYSDKNYQYNFTLYAGFDKEIVVLDNTQASTPNGVILWNEKTWQPELIGNYLQSNTPLIHPWKYEQKTGKKIDYIFRWHWNKSINDSSTLATNNIIDSLYTLEFSSANGYAELFRRK